MESYLQNSGAIRNSTAADSNPVVSVHVGIGNGVLTISGREGWALHALIKAGPKGITPLTWNGPRWSDYVFKLRRRGLNVDTIREDHTGAFSGQHARYVLKTPVRLIEVTRANGDTERVAA
jgi:hypothetical protein